MNIYVANLDYKVQEETLQEMFEEYGNVSSAKIVTDRETGRSRGFGFVEMPDDDEARVAIEGINGREVNGRNITVNEAKPREERSGGGGRPRSGGGGGGFRGGSGGGGGFRGGSGGGGGNRYGSRDRDNKRY